MNKLLTLIFVGAMATLATAQDASSIAARQVFYNQSWYDGNKVGIDAAPIPTTAAPLDLPHEDDADAIDPSKSPLLPGGGAATFANWTGYNKGINGLIYDITAPTRAPDVGDFTFQDIGRTGSSSPVNKTSSGFLVIAAGGVGGSDRVIITFANGSIKDRWLQVTIGAGFGLSEPDMHWWGNSAGDTGTGNTWPNATVNTQDEVMCRPPYTHNAFSRAPVDDQSDLNKDSLVNADDEVVTRPNPVIPERWFLQMITR